MPANADCSALLLWAASLGVTDVPRSAAPALGKDAWGHCSGDRALGYSLQIANFPDAGGRGLAASRNMKEGELILRVPKSALMSILSAKEDPQLAKAITLHPKLSSSQILTLHLLNEVAKGKLSSWYSYLVELPRSHHVLANFSESAIQALQVEDAIWVARQAVEKSMMEWEAVKAFMQGISLPRKFRSFTAWLWASATVSSRTLHVPWDGAGTLCPIGDLFNYAPPGELFCNQTINEVLHIDSESIKEDSDLEIDGENSWSGVTFREKLQDGGYEPDYNEYCFYARQEYQVGQQVLLCYGQYNNLELLEHYGFSMARNPNDNIHISLPDPAEFGSIGGSWPTYPSKGACIEVKGNPSFSLLVGLRLCAIQPRMRKARGHTALMGEQISVESDIHVYQWLWRKCESLLASLPTPLAGDLALLDLVNSGKDLWSIEGFCESLSEGNDNAEIAYVKSHPQVGDSDVRHKEVVPELKDLLMSVRASGKASGLNEEKLQIASWKLALEWRVGYKQILHRCCLLCAKKIRQLTSR